MEDGEKKKIFQRAVLIVDPDSNEKWNIVITLCLQEASYVLVTWALMKLDAQV